MSLAGLPWQYQCHVSSRGSGKQFAEGLKLIPIEPYTNMLEWNRAVSFWNLQKKVKKARGQKLWDRQRSSWLTVSQLAVSVIDSIYSGLHLLIKMRWRCMQELPGQACYCEIAGQAVCNGTLRRAATTKWLRLAPQGMEKVRQMFGSASWPITSC